LCFPCVEQLLLGVHAFGHGLAHFDQTIEILGVQQRVLVFGNSVHDVVLRAPTHFLTQGAMKVHCSQSTLALSVAWDVRYFVTVWREELEKEDEGDIINSSFEEPMRVQITNHRCESRGEISGRLVAMVGVEKSS
jgi:hypothetical protein